MNIIEQLNGRWKSGNGINVDRIHIKQDEWLQLMDLILQQNHSLEGIADALDEHDIADQGDVIKEVVSALEELKTLKSQHATGTIQ